MKAVAPSALGRELGLEQQWDEEQFAQRVPLSTYERYVGHVDQICRTGINSMSTLPLRQIGTTSGTSSGGKKLLPMVQQQASIFFFHGVCRAYYAILSQIPGTLGTTNKSCKIMFEPIFTHGPTGLLIGPNSSAPSNSKSAMPLYCSPPDVYQLPLSEFDSAMYLHAWYALRDENLGMLESNFAWALVELFQCIEKNFSSLLADISSGVVRGVMMSGRFREVGLPARAKHIRDCVESDPAGFQNCAPRFWPKLRLALTCDTGSMEIYGKRLRFFIGPNLPIYSPFLAATEGLIGVANNVTKKTYSFAWRSMYVEFLEASNSDSTGAPQTTRLCDLIVGREYELVITTYSGLVRYRLGDVVRIESLDPDPTFSFSYRRGTIMDLRGERVTENQFFSALSGLLRPSEQHRIVDYTLVHHLQLGSEKPRYHMFIELANGDQGEFLKDLDENLCLHSKGYAYHRKQALIHPVVIHKCAFREVLEHLRSKYPINQIKIPRVESRQEIIELLLRSEIGLRKKSLGLLQQPPQGAEAEPEDDDSAE